MDPVDLSSLIRSARKQAGLTLEEVAEMVEMTPGALSHIETGKRLPTPFNAVSIAAALGIEEGLVLEALDNAHRSRRMSSLETPASSRSRSPRASKSSAPARAVFQRQDISNLIPDPGPEASLSAPPYFETVPAESEQTYNRNLARWSNDTSARVEALGELADSASEALRTLRGLLEDEDPMVRREARRLLQELDVRLPEE